MTLGNDNRADSDALCFFHFLKVKVVGDRVSECCLPGEIYRLITDTPHDSTVACLAPTTQGTKARFRTLEAPMALLHSTVQYLEIKTFATQSVEWLVSFVLLTV